MDKVAAAAGLPPDEFRRRNFIRTGDTLAVGQTIAEPVNMAALLDRALALSGYHAKRARFTRENQGRAIKKGMGIASFMHGAGFTGSGEVHLASVVAVEGTPDGTVRVLSASTEIGQGTNTIFSQIAAEALGIDCADVDIVQPDTSVVPDSGPTVATHRSVLSSRDSIQPSSTEARAHTAASTTRTAYRPRVLRMTASFPEALPHIPSTRQDRRIE